ncbi:PREDICTED: elongation of very long chain fatty acids protein 4-like [Nicrophorus vespilloides]|uniref:Elongation of very long chain fatty acids protein n=1 Tax=Nicrophorus vespilloides TaxID=110193 RepID=A0ABM1MCP9_NICVS|nr:PREDICTED: elongation of very long chain fatty acids protein 4-like [Nicrophorus vespilloides]
METYNYLFHEIIDKRTENLPLMSPAVPVIIIGLYLLLVLKCLPKYMEKRKPYDLKTVVQCYNIIQIISCSTMVYGVCTSGWTFSKLTCWPIEYSYDYLPMRMLNCVWWTMILKISDLIETIFFVLRKKDNQVSNLHLYHHTSTYFISWIMTKYVGGAMYTFPIIINSFIHVLMYTYYFLSALGPQWRQRINHLKPKLTMLQMVQFCILLIYSAQVFYGDCDVSFGIAITFIIDVMVIFAFFINFYIKSYMCKKKK